MIRKLPCIGLVGYKGSGKNTVAKLIAGLNYEVVEESFALELRKKAAGIFDYDIEISFTEEGKDTVIESFIPIKSDLEFYDMDDERISLFYQTFKKFKSGNKYILTIREVLQFLGTEVYRATDENYWLNHVPVENGIVVTDTRFPNEAEYIKQNGGILINVTREGQENTDTHASEKYIETIVCDYYIHNDGKSLDTLSTNVYRAIESLRNKLCK